MTRIGSALLPLLASCATLFGSNSTATLAIHANPGQPVTIDGQPVGTSPTSVTISTHEDHVIQVGPSGCRLSSDLGVGWIALDILAGVWPLLVDAVTGDWRSIDGGGCIL